MTALSSSPRGEHAPRPGATWDTRLVRTEQLVDDDGPDPTPPNRATRRALARAARRTTVNNPADDGPSVREAAADDRNWDVEKAGEQP